LPGKKLQDFSCASNVDALLHGSIQLVEFSEEQNMAIHSEQERARLQKAFLFADASLRHEFGDNYRPDDAQLARERKVIDGEMSFDDAVAEILVPYTAPKRGG
jgi:ABC-type phosphate transport system auxiliary subunit